jgi:4-amino-4-deoxy-L-arabinose transferase-like glycosyltransferase
MPAQPARFCGAINGAKLETRKELAVMEPTHLQSLFENKRAIWIVGGLAVFLFALANLPWTLDDHDQAKQAFTSFEMMEEGHWFYQRAPQGETAKKPPLVGWISAASFVGTRSWEVAWRLPSFLAALIMMIALGRAVARACGRPAALIVIGAVGLNLLTMRLATLVRTDMPLTLVIFLLGLQIWEKIRSGGSWTTRDRWVVFALLTAAMLIKGPIVMAFLLPGIVLFNWEARRRKSGATAWCGAWPWIFSLAIFLLWLVGGIFTMPDFYHIVVSREFFGRFGETAHRPQPIYFYLPHLLHKFAPWSILLVALGVLMVRSQKIGIPAWWRRASPEMVWLACWILGGLLIMSLIPSKRVDRIFPIIPPLALLVATLFARCWNTAELRQRASQWSAVALICAMIFSGGYVGARVLAGYQADRGALADFGRRVREEARVHQWRYEVIGRRTDEGRMDEGLLLYLRRTRFFRSEDVIARWNAGELDAVIAPEEERPRLLRDLPGSIPSRLRSWDNENDTTPRYVLLTRS